MTKNLSLSKVKVDQVYTFKIEYNSGAGSGSQGWYYLTGKVKELNAEFIRVIPAFLLATSKRSVKIYNNSITAIALS